MLPYEFETTWGVDDILLIGVPKTALMRRRNELASLSVPVLMNLAALMEMDLPWLVGFVADYFNSDRAMIRSFLKKRVVSLGGIMCHLAIDRFGMSCAEIARNLNLNSSRVYKLATRVATIL
jgi:hypothetical protein